MVNICLVILLLIADRLTLSGPYHGMTRGEAESAVLASLHTQRLYKGEVEQEEEVLRSRFGDLVSIRDVRDVREIRDLGNVNLRKPVLIVSAGTEGPNVTISTNCNMKACDNKVIDGVGGRTGGFCTACDSSEKDMHGLKASEYYHMNMGLDRMWEQFETMRGSVQGQEQTRTEDLVIPSRRDDFRTRLGTKHAPLTSQLDPSQVREGV